MGKVSSLRKEGSPICQADFNQVFVDNHTSLLTVTLIEERIWYSNWRER